MSTPITGPRSAPLHTRAAAVTNASMGDRVIQVIWTTGAVVLRKGSQSLGIDELYEEELLVTDDAVDLTRLRAGAAVLDSHVTSTIAAQRAVVEDAWLQGGKGYASIRFPRAGIDPASDRLLGMAREGITRNISVGYSLNRIRIVEPTKHGQRVRVVVEKWTPCELSFVTVPADTGAQVLNGSKRLFPVQIIRGNARALTATEATRARMAARARAAGIK